MEQGRIPSDTFPVCEGGSCVGDFSMYFHVDDARAPRRPMGTEQGQERGWPDRLGSSHFVSSVFFWLKVFCVFCTSVRTWRLDSRTRWMGAVHSWSSPPRQHRASFSSQSMAWDITMFRAQGDGDEKVSIFSPVNTVHVSPEEARAGASLKVTRLQAALTSLGPNEVFVGSVFEKGTATGHFSTCCRTGKADCPVHQEGQVTFPVGSRLEIGVCQRVTRSRIAFGKDPCRGRGTSGSTPCTSRLGSRSHETPTSVRDHCTAESKHPTHAVVCRSNPVGGGTSFKVQGLRRGGAFNRASTRRVVYQTFGTQGCV